MAEKIKILQLTDIHISSEDINRNGTNIRSNFLKVMDAVKNVEHDLMVLTGDIAQDVHDNDYEWIKEQLKPYNLFAIPGNHDLSQNVAKSFGLEKYYSDTGIFYKHTYKGKDLVFADTSLEVLDIDRLNDIIGSSSKNGGTYVFMHHPPCKCNAKHMDYYYPLKNHVQATGFFNSCNAVEHIFTGHYHTAHQFENDNFTVHIAPSTWYQIGRKPKKFNILHTHPGWTMIEIGDEDVNVKNHFIKY